ncbi:aminoglycoside adenylyltransferase domain-containing protein [Neobacillus drentensis]|uniref:aminoglycoside adenylyltransferase domain-containing protein n=1 Tax=Neobacillus drentensis TaxID=220684 RepID=UPI0030013CEC
MTLIRVNLHPRIQAILNEYITRMQQVLPLQGLYIYGSIALGDYSLELSDIDFIAVTEARLNSDCIHHVEQVHRLIEKKYPKPNLNGIYVTGGDLGKLQDEIFPFPSYSDGKFTPAGYFECNMVTWYELKESGITILGPDARDLAYTVDWNQLISLMHENLNTYWQRWIVQSEKRLSLKSAALYLLSSEVEWGVLGITRLFYTFREHQITSKVRAGEYALQIVPERWHKILQEARRVRKGAKKSLYSSKWQRRSDTLDYMRYILQQANAMFE